MICTLNQSGAKVRNPPSRVRQGAPMFTGAVRYKIIGSIEGFDPLDLNAPVRQHLVRHALGTDSKQTAQRLTEKLRSAYVSGPDSALWPELKHLLPAETFKFFADRIQYKHKEDSISRATANPTWQDLRDIYEDEMHQRVEKYTAGEDKDVLSPRTEKTYKTVMDRFTSYLNGRTLLDSLTPIVIEKYKIDRRSRLKNGGSIALDMAVLHLMFAFAVQKELMAKNCINGKNETKPGKKPKAPARPLNADELQKLRDNAGNDMLAFLLLRWTGLRGNDAVT
jgi:hypothetical protein